ncbi:MAG: chromosome partitioning protein ParA, partial [Chloroflexota bacterium]
MEENTHQSVVIITGMHRSGTSLVANVLQQGGLNIGQNLLGPGHGNLRGHFEDQDFFHFHDSVLNRMGESWLPQKP